MIAEETKAMSLDEIAEDAGGDLVIENGTLAPSPQALLLASKILSLKQRKEIHARNKDNPDFLALKEELMALKGLLIRVNPYCQFLDVLLGVQEFDKQHYLAMLCLGHLTDNFLFLRHTEIYISDVLQQSVNGKTHKEIAKGNETHAVLIASFINRFSEMLGTNADIMGELICQK